jgi:hypothetical protein
MKKTIIAAAALVAMVSCNKSLIEVSQSDYGFIDFGLAADTEIIDTKAQETVAKEGSEYNVTLSGPGANWTKEYAAIQTADLTVSKGRYTIEAENYTADEAEAANDKYGDVRVVGQTTVDVVAGGTTPATVACTPVNAKVTVAFAEGFEEVFQGAEVLLIDAADERQLEMKPAELVKDENDVLTHGGTGYSVAYFNIEEGDLQWKISADINGVSKEFTSTFPVEAAKWNQITFSSGTNGKLTITITADKTINEVKDYDVEVDPLS